MTQVFANKEKVGNLTKLNATQVQLSPSVITIGAKQYQTSNLICDLSISGAGGLDTGNIQSNQLYYVYVIVELGITKLIASINSTIPVGFTLQRKIGAIQINNNVILMTANLNSDFDTDWVEAGPLVISATTTAPTKGTTTIDKTWWKRSRGVATFRTEYKQIGAGGAGSGDYLFQNPLNLEIDVSKITPYTTIEGAGVWNSGNTVGNATLADNSNSHLAAVSVYSEIYIRAMEVNAAGNGVTGSAYTPISQAGFHFNSIYNVPIKGWTAQIDWKQY